MPLALRARFGELREMDGSEYTPRIICQFVSGLEVYISDQRENPVRLVDPTNPVFRSLHRVFEKSCRDL